MAIAPKLTLDQAQLLGRVASHAGRLDVRKLSPREERMAARLEQLGLVDVSEWSVTLTFKGRAHLAAEAAAVKPAPAPAEPQIRTDVPTPSGPHIPTSRTSGTIKARVVPSYAPDKSLIDTAVDALRDGPISLTPLPEVKWRELIEWREPKRLSRFGGRRSSWIEPFLEALRGRPGDWACVRKGPFNQLQSLASAARLSSRRRGWDLQIMIRKATDQSAEIFARYVPPVPKATP